MQFLNKVVRFAAEVESKMNAVERVVEYTGHEPEAPAVIEASDPGPLWPTGGQITFENLVLRYRPELSPALRGLSVNVNAGEKVGVVGRTGAGKSSLMLALFRLVEAEEGSIRVDGVDISLLGLEVLRSRLAIIPQDPAIFSGTMRSNLDPFERHTDEEIWTVVERAGLRSVVSASPARLGLVVKEGGENLSVGTRQLICLARALLRSPRVLVMDEATASVDVETDAAIQQCVRAQFANSTVLTIAHRLNTVMDSDRILVLSEGKVAEFDSPAALLDNPVSLLSNMVSHTGAANALHLRKIAAGEVAAFAPPPPAEERSKEAASISELLTQAAASRGVSAKPAGEGGAGGKASRRRSLWSRNGANK
eukprot:TRINITY_DN1368_c0_g1_i3.p1 TRINITY_DN1368_c0_g1~~TRINITY_DN1368_c0_g1_i3.p1  ORF type:complete len:366 (-),score=94.22 TRINITY_DN1368_c0_g1_i3:717-1814(-)